MKKPLLILSCLCIAYFGHSQDTFTYKTVKASRVAETTIALEDVPQETGTPGSKSINLSSKGGGTVNGGTVGELSVSPTGAATYTVPIDVPPGLNGVQPEIFLNFNSQSGNGLAGWGWNVSGISVITRIPATQFHDNKIDAVDFDLDDRFSFDGQRLILKTGTYGTNGAVYQTEKYSNIKIISYGSHPTSGVSGPSYFKVLYPDGSLAYYGHTSSSANSRSHTDYAISYWENPQGVRIKYSYAKANNTLSIDKITYGSRGTASPINEIKFVFGSRKRNEQSYINGIGFIRKTILTQIKVKGGSTPYRNYVLQHDETSLGYDRLTSIREMTGDNSIGRSPITFTYGNTAASINSIERVSQLTVQHIEQRNAEVVSLDISGNGKMDFIVYPKTGTDAKRKFWLFDDIQDAGNRNFHTEVNTGRFEDIFPVSWLNHQQKLLPNQGLAVVQNISNNRVKFKVLSSGGAVAPIAYKYEKTWNAPTYTETSFCGIAPRQYRIPQKYLSGDFDGDGLSDIIALGKPYSSTTCLEVIPNPGEPCGFESSDPLPNAANAQSSGSDTQNQATAQNVSSPPCCQCETTAYSSSRIHLIRLDRRLTSNFVSGIGSLSRGVQNSDKFLTLDVNGDGKTDILQFREGKVFVYALSNNNSALQLLWTTTDSRIKLEFPILPGDYNGDGKADFMIPTVNNNRTFATFLSAGNNFVKSEKLEPFEYKAIDFSVRNTIFTYNLIPVDINGDGRTDILDYRTRTHPAPHQGRQWVYVYQNTKSTSTTVVPKFSATGSVLRYGNLRHFPIPVFLSSDRPNSNLDFATISDRYVTSFSFTKDHREDVTLKRVTNNGVTTHIKYDQVNPHYSDTGDADYFTAYSPSYGQAYPFVNINVAPSFKVVRELVHTCSGLTRTQRLYYKGAVSHAGGLGFIGFRELKRSNWYGTGVGTLWHISKYNPSLRGTITEELTATTSISNPSKYLSKTKYFYDEFLVANRGSPIAPVYRTSISRNAAIPGQQTDEAEEFITLIPGFSANGTHGTYWAKIVPPEQQPGAPGYAGVYDVRLKRLENHNGLTGVRTAETYTYDAYNNPLSTLTNFPGGSRTVAQQYSTNTGAVNSSYHVGRPTRTMETVRLNGNSFSTEERYTYSNNLVTKIQKKGNGTSWLTEDFRYDANGNVLSKTLSGPGMTARTERFEYSGTYGSRFLTKSIDIEGLQTVFTYQAATGNLLSTTDPYNRSTSFAYDKWDRISKATDYLSKETRHTYTVLGGGGLQHRVDHADGAKELTNYNAFGWVTRTGVLSLNNTWIYKDYEYDVSGRKKRVSEPHGGSPSQWTTFAFDAEGRLVTQQWYTGRTINTSYSGLSVTVNDGIKSTTTTMDALGNTVKIQNPGGTVNYTYFANGTMKTADHGGHVVTVGIDGWGRRTRLNDPSAGTYTYTYNSFGELLTETTPKGTTTYAYDAFGKPTSKTMTGDLTDHSLAYVYDNTTKLLTTINGRDLTNSNRTYTYQYTYDSYKRPATITENTGLASFEHRTTYDGYGRVHKETQIAALTGGASKTVTTRNGYDASGILKEIWNDGTTDRLWQLNRLNARGQALSVTLGNGMHSTKTYDAYGYLTEIEDKESGTDPTVALHMEYDFNEQRGTLTRRKNFGFNWQENFGYDNLDRLTTISGHTSRTMAYDARGRITNNSALGSYAYTDTHKKYRLTQIDPNMAGGTYFQQHPTQQISYNAFKKPVEIRQTDHGRASFEYGPMMNRSTAYYGGEDEARTDRRYRKHYSAIIPAEIVEDRDSNTTKIITYVGGDAYTAPIAHIKGTGTGGVDEYHYLHRDYLGSILAITDADGDVKEQRQFGAWGTVDKFRDSGTGTTFGHGSLLGRGYTGHEHFFEVGLIHMNGRMYDAQLGRFLAPDNHIQEPFNPQNFNRYSYALNNPLMYVDPSGEFFLEIAALIDIAVKVFFVASAILGTYSFIKNFSGGSGSRRKTVPAPSNNGNNSKISSSISGPSRGNPKYNFELSDRFEYSTPIIPSTNFGNNHSGSAYGISQNGSTLQGNDGFGITAEDVVDTALDFVPIAGGINDIRKGIRDGNGWQVALGAGFIVLDVFTLGSASLIKGAVKTGVKVGARAAARNAVKGGATTWNQFQKMTAGQFATRAEAGAAWTTFKKNSTVLGSYNPATGGYVGLAEKLGARYFDIPSRIWNKMSSAQRWAANQKFLDRMIARGDNIILSNSAFRAEPGTYFYRELKYLYSKGYKPTVDGMSLIK
ncbi:RHS repeat-associated core domain-containing protein [Spongiimicrobium sp. 2-473A-2-J]|uniref:RHS repeat-associated core domain-containing protein n=1 Tax=Eudoraea algarum TaxID=3417568 RepID=UPI003D360312